MYPLYRIIKPGEHKSENTTPESGLMAVSVRSRDWAFHFTHFSGVTIKLGICLKKKKHIDCTLRWWRGYSVTVFKNLPNRSPRLEFRHVAHTKFYVYPQNSLKLSLTVIHQCSLIHQSSCIQYLRCSHNWFLLFPQDSKKFLPSQLYERKFLKSSVYRISQMPVGCAVSKCIRRAHF